MVDKGTVTLSHTRERPLLKCVNPKRIVWACEAYGIAIDDLSKAVSIPTNKLIQAELIYEELTKVSEYFGLWFTFFMKNYQPLAKSVFSASMLRVLKMDVSIRVKRLVLHVEGVIEMYDYLCEKIQEPKKPLTFNPKANPEDIFGVHYRNVVLQNYCDRELTLYKTTVHLGGITTDRVQELIKGN